MAGAGGWAWGPTYLVRSHAGALFFTCVQRYIHGVKERVNSAWLLHRSRQVGLRSKIERTDARAGIARRETEL